jgi:hypothetical protein
MLLSDNEFHTDEEQEDVSLDLVEDLKVKLGKVLTRDQA